MQLYTNIHRPPVLLASQLLDYPGWVLTNYFLPSHPDNRWYLQLDGDQVPTIVFDFGRVPFPAHFPYGLRVRPDLHG